MKNFNRTLTAIALSLGLVFSFAPLIAGAQTATVTAVLNQGLTVNSDSIVAIVTVKTTYMGTTVPGFTGSVYMQCTDPAGKEVSRTTAIKVQPDGDYNASCGGLKELTTYKYQIYTDNDTFTRITGSSTTPKGVAVRTGGETYSLSGTPTMGPSSKSGGSGTFQASATVNFTKPIQNVSYDVQIGVPSASQTNCIIDPVFNKTGMTPTGSPITTQTAKYSGDGSDFIITKNWDPIPKGTYCLGIVKEDKADSRNFITAMGLLTGSIFYVGPAAVAPDPADVTNTPNAYGCVSNGTANYCMLAPIPIPDSQGNIDPTGNIDVQQGLGNYLTGIIKLVMGLITVLAVFMIVVGGIEYMSTVSVGEKEGAKDRIVNALLGLVLALGSFIILNTINPDLTDVKVTIPTASLTLDLSQSEGDDGLGIGAGDGTLGDTNGEKTKNLSGSKIKNAAGAELTACNSAGLVSIPVSALDQGMGIFTQSGSIQVNAAVKDSLIAGFTAYKAAVTAKPSLKDYKIKTMYGYSCRGAVGKRTVWSGHAFGVAVDINATTNPFTKGAVVTDLPTELVTALKGAGFGWGGNWNSVKDAMHFSKLGNEQGKGVDSYRYEK